MLILFYSKEIALNPFNISLFSFQNALNSQRVTGLVKTAETMGILDTASETAKQQDIDEILGFLAALEKVRRFHNVRLS
jgi:hypothetical protein